MMAVLRGLVLSLGFAFASWFGTAAAEDAIQPLVLEAKIPLERVTGRIDHLGLDLGRRRLFVAELGNNSLDVIDLDTRRPIHRISGLSEPQGVAYVPGIDAVVIANSRDGSVRFFTGDDLAALGRLDLGDDADNVRVVQGMGRVVVGYGGGGLAVLDVATRTKVADIKLPAHPESFQVSADGTRAFVNLPDAKQIAVVDLAAGQQIANWPVPDLRGNFSMALDEASATVAVVFRSPARLMLLDAGTGGVKEQIETCGDSDDVFFDARRGRIYVSCGEGVVDVLERTPSLHRVTRVPTPPGARTALFVPELDRLFVAARADKQSGEAAILVFRPGP